LNYSEWQVSFGDTVLISTGTINEYGSHTLTTHYSLFEGEYIPQAEGIYEYDCEIFLPIPIQ